MITMAVRVMAESDLFLKIKLSEKLESKQLPKKIIAIIRYDCSLNIILDLQMIFKNISSILRSQQKQNILDGNW